MIEFTYDNGQTWIFRFREETAEQMLAQVSSMAADAQLVEFDWFDAAKVNKWIRAAIPIHAYQEGTSSCLDSIESSTPPSRQLTPYTNQQAIDQFFSASKDGATSRAAVTWSSRAASVVSTSVACARSFSRLIARQLFRWLPRSKKRSSRSRSAVTTSTSPRF